LRDGIGSFAKGRFDKCILRLYSISHDGYRAEGANMLPPHQIRNVKQISPFSLAVEEVKVDGVDKGPAQILVASVKVV